GCEDVRPRSEVSSAGHVNFRSYFPYFDLGRVSRPDRWLRSGWSPSWLGAHRRGCPTTIGSAASRAE
ncbi:hypothetical protein FOZ63_030149, partial [Perkinsus olseni]